MREINAQLITDKVAELCIDANCSLPCDIRKRIEDARANEPWATAQGILDKISKTIILRMKTAHPSARIRALPVCF